MVALSDKETKMVHFFMTLDRRLFLPEPLHKNAEWDVPLPIGFGQTISQPTLVLEMTIRLDLHKDHKVLEVGTGSGYQTAFLAEFAAEVFTIERHEALAIIAQANLSSLEYSNIHFRVGDGSEGWKEEAPFDRIIVTAAAGSKPYALMDQLKRGGKLLLPIGTREMQKLMLITRLEDDSFSETELLAVQFVEFVGAYGWED